MSSSIEEMPEGKLQITVRFASAGTIGTNAVEANVDSTMTLGSFKDWLHQNHPTVIPPSHHQRLIYKGRILHKNDVPLNEIILGASDTTTPNNTPTSSDATLFLVMTNSGNNSLAATSSLNTANPGLFSGNSGTDAEERPRVGGGGGLTATTTTNDLLEQLASENPMVREVLQDPAMMRQMLQAATNPHARAMQERSHDLQLANIENMPGGMAALQNMYEQMMQNPLEDSLASSLQQPPSSSSSNNNNNNTSSSTTTTSNLNNLAGAAGTAMPNPWGSHHSNRRAGNNNNTNPFTSAPTTNPFQAMMMSGGAGAAGTGAGVNNSIHNNPWAAAAAAAGSAANNDTNRGSSSNNSMMQSMFMGAGGGGIGSRGMPSPQERAAALQMLEENPNMRTAVQQMLLSNPNIFREMAVAQAGNNPMAAAVMQNMTDEQIQQMVQMSLDPNNNNLRNLPMEPHVVPPQHSGLAFPPSFFGTSTIPAARIPPTYNPWAASNNEGISTHPAPTTTTTSTSTSPLLHPSSTAPSFDRLLQQLRDMGFVDDVASMSALNATHGNLNRAVDWLLSSPPPPPPETSPSPPPLPPPSYATPPSDTTTNATPPPPDAPSSDSATEKKD